MPEQPKTLFSSIQEKREPTFEDKRKIFFARLGRKYIGLMRLHREQHQTQRNFAKISSDKPHNDFKVKEYPKRESPEMKAGRARRTREKKHSNPRRLRWGDPTEHCLVEAAAVGDLANLVGLTKKDQENLIKAAIIHDYAKKREIEETGPGADVKDSNNAFTKSKEILKAKIGNKFESGNRKGKEKYPGLTNEIIELSEPVGYPALPEFAYKDKNDDGKIKLKDDIDWTKAVMFYIDNVTSGSNLVTNDQRMDVLDEAAKTRCLYNNDGIPIWGVPYFKAQREVARLIEEKLVNKINKNSSIDLEISEPKQLPIILKERLRERINVLDS